MELPISVMLHHLFTRTSKVSECRSWQTASNILFRNVKGWLFPLVYKRYSSENHNVWCYTKMKIIVVLTAHITYTVLHATTCTCKHVTCWCGLIHCVQQSIESTQLGKMSTWTKPYSLNNLIYRWQYCEGFCVSRCMTQSSNSAHMKYFNCFIHSPIPSTWNKVKNSLRWLKINMF